MLSKKAARALCLARNKLTQSVFSPVSTSCTSPNYYGKPDKLIGAVEENPDRKLKEWRETFKSKEPLLPVNSDNDIFKMFRTQIEFTPWGLKKHLKKAFINKQITLQEFQPQRHKLLGPDLGLAYFLVYVGGKVKFKGKDEWVSIPKNGKALDLPQKFDPNYVVTEVDASECVLYYEGLDNFQGCSRVKWASFARCPEIDDWCIDRIAFLFPNIEYLDLSDCPKVSERGLEALYKTGMLKTLIVTNNYKSAAFELTCMMLEDVVPGLQIDIREPKGEMKPEINEL